MLVINQKDTWLNTFRYALKPIKHLKQALIPQNPHSWAKSTFPCYMDIKNTFLMCLVMVGEDQNGVSTW